MQAHDIPEAFLLAVPKTDLHVHLEVQVPTRLDAKQEELLRDLALLRGEERPVLTGKGSRDKGLFGKLRDAFKEK